MEIPTNILKDLEEQKARVSYANATQGDDFYRPEAETGENDPLSDPEPVYTEAVANTSEGESSGYSEATATEDVPRSAWDMDIERREPVAPMLESDTHKHSGGGLFFSYLSKIAIYFAVFLTPLFFFSSSDPLNLSKQLLLSVLATAALTAWIGKIIATGHVTWRKNFMQWAILGVAASAVLSSVFSSSFWVSFLGDAGRYSFSGVSLLSYLIIFVVALQSFEKREIKTILALWLASSFIAAVYALMQLFGIFLLPYEAFKVRLFNSVGGIFGLSLFVLMNVPFIITALGEVKNKIAKSAMILVAVTELVVAGLIDFRAGWIALIASALMLAMISFVRTPSSANSQRDALKQYQKRIFLPLALIMLAALMWFLVIPPLKGVTYPSEVNPSYGASADVLVKTLKEKPIFGAGLETFPYQYAKFKSDVLNQTDFWGINFNDSASEYITWGVNTGVVGIVALLFFISAFVVYAFKKVRRSECSNVSIGIFASWFFVLAVKTLYVSSIPLEFFFWILPLLFVLSVQNIESEKWEYHFEVGSVKTLVLFFSLMIVLLATLSGAYFSIRRWGAELDFSKVLSSTTMDEKNRDSMLSEVDLAITANPYEVRYFRALSQLLFQKMNDVLAAVQKREPAERQANAEEAALLRNLTIRTISAVQRTRALDPDNVGIVVDAAESYRNLVSFVQGADDLAIQNYERASVLEPINPFIKTQLGQLYLIKSGLLSGSDAKSDKELLGKAKGVLEEALKLNPNYANAKFFVSLIYDIEGNKKLALENFQAMKAANPDNAVVAQIVKNLENGWPALGIPPAPATPPQPTSADETKGVPSPAPVAPKAK